jgi:hypothetical protein
MGKKKFSKQNLIDLLVKKANGFYYKEEQLEFEKPQKNIKNIEKPMLNNQNISFFDNYDRGLTQNDKTCDMIELSNGQDDLSKQISENFTLIKKKITTHFIPPDMLAIKILFEIFGKEVGENDIENLTDEELLNLKNKLLTELSNEDKNN